MKYVIVVQTPPHNAVAINAFRFTEALLKCNQHQIQQIFFYGDGVYTANSLMCPAQDDFDLHENWVSLLSTHNIPAIICIAAGLKRGIIDQQEADRYNKNATTMAQPFELGGLGQLIEASNEADRVITFQ